jgi:hypothetical protein
VFRESRTRRDDEVVESRRAGACIRIRAPSGTGSTQFLIHAVKYPRTKLTHRGYHGASQEIPHLLSSAKEVGYPLLIKPTHGGGGKGMRVVHNHEVLEEEIMIAKREALKSFGNDEVLLERWLERPRHVEVQVFADEMGGVVSLWERDCSVQRRHQSESKERAERAGLDPSGGMVVQARMIFRWTRSYCLDWRIIELCRKRVEDRLLSGSEWIERNGQVERARLIL